MRRINLVGVFVLLAAISTAQSQFPTVGMPNQPVVVRTAAVTVKVSAIRGLVYPWALTFLPNGDFTGTALVTVYGCRPGTLDLTILGKTGNPVDVRVDGITVAHLETAAGDAVTHHVAAPPYADGSRRCVFDLENPGYAGSTTIAFTPS